MAEMAVVAVVTDWQQREETFKESHVHVQHTFLEVLSILHLVKRSEDCRWN